MKQATKLKWANKVLRAKNFVVLTDKESIIAVEGVKPMSLNDLVMLSEQAAAIENFIFMLKDLQAEHEDRVKQLMEELNGKPKKKRVASKPRKTTKAIKVQEK